MTTIFDPIKLGDLELPNRIIMAPLTRCRADEGRVPNALMAEYYVQRASAGLILSEATSVTPMGVGYPDTPGIWADDQVRGWTNITKAVHAAGGRIMMQLWHVGRISHPMYLNGEAPVAHCALHPGHSGSRRNAGHHQRHRARSAMTNDRQSNPQTAPPGKSCATGLRLFGTHAKMTGKSGSALRYSTSTSMPTLGMVTAP